MARWPKRVPGHGAIPGLVEDPELRKAGCECGASSDELMNASARNIWRNAHMVDVRMELVKL